jgi:hypothetical protein
MCIKEQKMDLWCKNHKNGLQAKKLFSFGTIENFCKNTWFFSKHEIPSGSP